MHAQDVLNGLECMTACGTSITILPCPTGPKPLSSLFILEELTSFYTFPASLLFHCTRVFQRLPDGSVSSADGYPIQV